MKALIAALIAAGLVWLGFHAYHDGYPRTALHAHVVCEGTICRVPGTPPVWFDGPTHDGGHYSTGS